ncbi:MAG: hypothetical protein ACKODX_22275 [Gemmata sp.]
MTDPNNSNDDWADLAREFALDKPAAPAPVDPDDREERAGAGEPHTEELEAEAAETTDGPEEGDEAGDASPGESGAECEGGTGRKRRRRRRRRRKGGAPGEAPAAGTAAAGDDEGEAEGSAEEVPDVEPAAEADDFAAPAGDEGDDFEPEPAPLAAEEDTASEALRELIATWNVPSWDSIVSGLYRPN